MHQKVQYVCDKCGFTSESEENVKQCEKGHLEPGRVVDAQYTREMKVPTRIAMDFGGKIGVVWFSS
jgi:hypothetical protein